MVDDSLDSRIALENLKQFALTKSCLGLLNDYWWYKFKIRIEDSKQSHDNITRDD